MTNKSSEAEIRALIDSHANALRAKDAKAVLSHYAPGVMTFDLAPPLMHAGSEADGVKALESWFATWQGPLGCETRDFSITTEGDLALGYGFVRIHGTKVGGERNDLWARQTLGLRRIAGAWKIMHEHTSVPFYMDGSYKAAIDLKP
jgi:PhnB protein